MAEVAELPDLEPGTLTWADLITSGVGAIAGALIAALTAWAVVAANARHDRRRSQEDRLRGFGVQLVTAVLRMTNEMRSGNLTLAKAMWPDLHAAGTALRLSTDKSQTGLQQWLWSALEPFHDRVSGLGYETEVRVRHDLIDVASTIAHWSVLGLPSWRASQFEDETRQQKQARAEPDNA